MSGIRRRTRLLVAALALAVPSALISYVALPSEAAAVPAAGQTYQLAVTRSGMCIDVTAGSKDNSALLQQWGCASGATWQQFKLVAVGSNYQLVNVNSGKCIDVPDFSTTSGVASAWWVRSSPTMVTGHGSRNTICAASGSQPMLNSLTGVRLPRA